MAEDDQLGLGRIRDAGDHRNRADDLIEETEADYERAFEEMFDRDVNADATVNENREIVEVEVRFASTEAPDAIDDELTVAQSRPMVFRVGDRGDADSQRDRIRGIKEIVGELQDEYDDGAPVEKILDEAEWNGMDRSKAEHEIEKLKQQGELYQPNQNHLRTL